MLTHSFVFEVYVLSLSMRNKPMTKMAPNVGPKEKTKLSMSEAAKQV